MNLYSDIHQLGLLILEMTGESDYIITSPLYSEELKDLISKCLSSQRPTAGELLHHPIIVSIANSSKSLFDLYHNTAVSYIEENNVPLSYNNSSLFATPASSSREKIPDSSIRSLTRKPLEFQNDTPEETIVLPRQTSTLNLIKTVVINVAKPKNQLTDSSTTVIKPVPLQIHAKHSSSTSSEEDSESDSELQTNSTITQHQQKYELVAKITETREDRVRAVIREELNSFENNIMTNIHAEMKAVVNMLSVISSQVISIQEDLSNLTQ